MALLDVGASYRLVVTGAPVTKKNHPQIAVNRTTGRPFVVQAPQLRKWAREAEKQLKAQWSSGAGYAFAPIGQPVEMRATVYRARKTGDLLNYLAAISDALEDAGILVNDIQVRSVDGSRLDKDKDNPRVEVTVTVIAGDPSDD